MRWSFHLSSKIGSANGRWCRKTGCPLRILEEAEKIGIRTLGVPEEFGGVELEKGTEVRTFAMIAEEIARGDSGLADKLVQNWKVSVLLRSSRRGIFRKNGSSGSSLTRSS